MSLYNTTLDQPFVFAAFLYIGILIGVLHSLFRGIIRIFGSSRWIVICGEILFLIAAGAMFFYLMYRITGMKFRGYHFFGAASGYMLYAAAIRPITVWINCKFHKKKIDNSRSK